mgnify:CR=1 FL=1
MIFVIGVIAGLVQVDLGGAPWNHITSDSKGYIERASQIASGKGLEPFQTFFPLGISYCYALFFLLLDDSVALKAISFLQVVAVGLSHVLAYLTARDLFGTERVARLASSLSVAYWPLTAQVSFYMAEPIFMLMLLGGQYLVVRSAQADSPKIALLAGIAVGIAVSIKTQGLIVLIGLLIVSIIYVSLRKVVVVTAMGVGLVMLAHTAHIGEIRDGAGLRMPANGAFNLYLGQSAVHGLGASNIDEGRYLFFYNNNGYMEKGLLPPRSARASSLDQSFFIEATLELWLASPWRQMVRTMQSGFELHAITPHWPLRAMKSMSAPELVFKYLAIPLVYFPAILALVLCLRIRAWRYPVLILILPILGITAAAGLSMGQPRYLLPFLPNLFMLAAVGWSAFAVYLSRNVFSD